MHSLKIWDKMGERMTPLSFRMLTGILSLPLLLRLQSLSRREKRIYEKPWISKGILKSIKTKNKLFRSHYCSNDLDKKLFYRKYLNQIFGKTKFLRKLNQRKRK